MDKTARERGSSAARVASSPTARARGAARSRDAVGGAVLLGSAFDHATVGFAVVDERGLIVRVNAALCRMLGRPGEVLDGTDLLAYAEPEDAARVRIRPPRLLVLPGQAESGSPWVRFLRPDGGSIIGALALIAAEAPDDGNDRPGHGLVEVVEISHVDPTRRSAERGEEWFRALVQHGTDVILVVDFEGRISYASPSCLDQLGHDPAELERLRVRDLIHEDDYPAWRDVRPLLSARPHENLVLETRFRHGDSWKVFECVVSNSFGVPAVRGFVVNARDVTDRVQAEQSLRMRTAQQAEVVALGEQALRDPEVGHVIDYAVKRVAAMLGTQFASYWELRRDGDLLLRAAVGTKPESVGNLVAPGGGSSLAGYTCDLGRPVTVEDYATESRFVSPAIIRNYGITSALCVPVKVGGHPHGTFTAHTKERRVFTDDDVHFVQAVANTVSSALERERAAGLIRHQAVHDPLTGLPNRVLLAERITTLLRRRMRRNPPAIHAVLLFDLDRFKHVNDSLGHDAGDELLLAVASRLKQVVRAGDMVARLGGDEFVVLAEDLNEPAEAVALANRLRASLGEPVALSGRVLHAGCSTGMVVIGDGHDRAEDVLRDADSALYRAKDRGRGRVEVFDRALRTEILTRMETEEGLRRALSRDELFLLYQPVVSLETGRISGFEALVRWLDPRRGLVTPAEFIPVAEETGLVVPLGHWALLTACRQLAEWRDMSGGSRLTMAVNVSPRQLASGMEDTVTEVLLATGIPAGALSLEITEGTLMDDTTGARRVLEACRALGVKVAVDDFGTGYSSLSYLRRLPIDALKIDRSFVDGLGHDEDDTTIAGLVAGMAHALGFQVIGEGVEDSVQEDALLGLGCRLAQGFRFARPLTPDAVREHLARNPFWWRSDVF